MNIFETQYELIRRSRESLFTYCESMSSEDYLKKIDPFGGISIPALHTHVADGYRVWLGNRALGKSIPKVNSRSIVNVENMREVFKDTDELVYEFLKEFKDRWDPTTKASWHSSSAEQTELWLFTHTTTHEYHHRGQIVKIGSHLGYVPPKLNLPKPL
ncbi:DinB family protein [Alkalicoccobacillus porphyridii]|uniref:Damage-inducible protein DinB n=1 Tax=Alkalicoccobacillus porphyridii TaxID=2597270 RepID=A0A554A274_9BACI|nr:DinB family protein [Alkalicoccobacillus porphyridii]TSB47792.1 damage-inducible protein DinB [Alkalicoccobacillus porphyridii]